MELIFFLLHLFAARDMSCITQYGNVCETASLGPGNFGFQIGEQVYVRYGTPEPIKGVLIRHEQCHVKYYRIGRIGTEEICQEEMMR